MGHVDLNVHLVEDDMHSDRTVTVVLADGTVVDSAHPLPASVTNAVILAPSVSSRNVVQPTADATGLTLRPFSDGQTSPAFQIENADGSADWLTVKPEGVVEIGGSKTAIRLGSSQVGVDEVNTDSWFHGSDPGRSALVVMMKQGGAPADYTTGPFFVANQSGASMFSVNAVNPFGVNNPIFSTVDVNIGSDTQSGLGIALNSPTAVGNYLRFWNGDAEDGGGVDHTGSFYLSNTSSSRGRRQAVWSGAFVDPTDATYTARFTVSAYDHNGAKEVMRGEADGSGPRVGFLGANAVPRQLMATGAGHTVDDVITALQTVGLFKQS